MKDHRAKPGRRAYVCFANPKSPSLPHRRVFLAPGAMVPVCNEHNRAMVRQKNKAYRGEEIPESA